MRLIDVDVPRKQIVDWLNWYTGSEAVKCAVQEVLETFDEAPTIDAEPVRHGQWEKICTSYWRWKPDGAHVVNRFKYRHNDCGKVVVKAEPYCPGCGAKMDKTGD